MIRKPTFSAWFAFDQQHRKMDALRDAFTDARDDLKKIDPAGWSAWYDAHVPDSADLEAFYSAAAETIRRRVVYLLALEELCKPDPCAGCEPARHFICIDCAFCANAEPLELTGREAAGFGKMGPF